HAPGQAQAYHYPQEQYPQDQYPQEHYAQGHYPQEPYAQGDYPPDPVDRHQPFATPVRHPPFFGEQPAPQRQQQPSPYGSAFEELLASQQREQAAQGYYDDQGLSQLQTPGQPRRSHT